MDYLDGGTYSKKVMAQNIKKIIAQEYIKCAKDPVYFMRKYCYIQHPTRGRILFNLYPFQDKVLHLFRDHQFLITLKSRQLGISTLAAGYSLWLMLFHKDKNVLALATTQATARNLVTKTMFMYDELPKWLKLPAVEKNKLSLRLKNGSKITAKSSNADAARSEAVSLLLIDEAAFIDNIEETFTAAQQTLATGGQCMALSTPNGIGNWFHQT
jgi:phage terminase large subunit-like protein